MNKAHHVNKSQIPIAFCPSCSRAIMYSGNSKDKGKMNVQLAPLDYKGATYRCPKCNQMLIVSEKPQAARAYVTLPIVSLKNAW